MVVRCPQAMEKIDNLKSTVKMIQYSRLGLGINFHLNDEDLILRTFSPFNYCFQRGFVFMLPGLTDLLAVNWEKCGAACCCVEICICQNQSRKQNYVLLSLVCFPYEWMG